MKKNLFLIFILFVFLLVNIFIGLHFYKQFKAFKLKNFPLNISRLQNEPAIDFDALDVNSDGRCEIVLSNKFSFSGTKSFRIFEPFNPLFNFPFFFDIIIPEHYYFIDVYYDDLQKQYLSRFLSSNENGELFIITLNNKQKLVRSLKLQEIKFKLKKMGGGIVSINCLDIDNDNKKELIFIYHMY